MCVYTRRGPTTRPIKVYTKNFLSWLHLLGISAYCNKVKNWIWEKWTLDSEHENIAPIRKRWKLKMVKKYFASLPGFEPGTFGLEVQRAIHCATGTDVSKRSFPWNFKRGYFITEKLMSLDKCLEKMTF